MHSFLKILFRKLFKNIFFHACRTHYAFGYLGFRWDSFLTANMTIVSHSKVTLLLFCLYYFCVIITTHPCQLC